jgi:hypothetical protein
MTHQLRNSIEVYPRLNQTSCKGMSQIVKMEVNEPCSLDCPFKRVLQNSHFDRKHYAMPLMSLTLDRLRSI